MLTDPADPGHEAGATLDCGDAGATGEAAVSQHPGGKGRGKRFGKGRRGAEHDGDHKETRRLGRRGRVKR